MSGVLMLDKLEASRYSLKHLDLAFGNLCNLTCATCESRFSSSWAGVDKKMNTEHPWRESFAPSSLTQGDIEKVISVIPSLKSIELKGGEPLMHPLALDFLRRVHEQSPQISLFITTNFTIVKPDIIRILSKFDNLTMNLSIDGVGRVYEWIRGFSFKALERNIINFLPQIVGTERYCLINFVSSVYNVNTLSEFWDWAENISDRTQVNLIPDFSIIALYPDYVSPSLFSDPAAALKDLAMLRSKVKKNLRIEDAKIKKLIQQINLIEDLLESPSLDEQVALRHEIWHRQLVKKRGWDIYCEPKP
jgi:hypothetical protein